MKSKISIILLFSMMGVTPNLCAQNDKQQQKDEIAKQRLQESLARGNNKRVMQQAIPVQEIAVQDAKYNHQEKEILAKLNTETIPEDFPVFKSEFTQDEYTAIMNKWYSTHPALIKKETEK